MLWLSWMIIFSHRLHDKIMTFAEYPLGSCTNPITTSFTTKPIGYKVAWYHNIAIPVAYSFLGSTSFY
jgi:hypothetical protein